MAHFQAEIKALKCPTNAFLVESSNLAVIQRPGHWVGNCKMVYFLYHLSKQRVTIFFIFNNFVKTGEIRAAFKSLSGVS